MFGQSKDRISLSKALVNRAEDLMKEAGLETVESRVLFQLAQDIISGTRTVSVTDVLACTRDVRQVVAAVVATQFVPEQPAAAVPPSPAGENPKG
mgnify:CR=1 FL=1